MIQQNIVPFISKAETIVSESDINDGFESIYNMIISSIWKSLGKGLGWIVDSVVNHTNVILKYKPLAGSSYIKLHKVSNHSKKGLINNQNIDENECFKRCLVRYLHPQIIIQQESEKSTKILQDNLILKI